MIHKAKKSLGQNFLKSKPALSAMISAGEVNGKDIVIEIGPGKGVLTEKLLEKAGRVIAIEKDRELVKFLQEKFKKEIANEKLELVEDDCLRLTPENLFSKFFSGPRISSRGTLEDLRARPDHSKNLKINSLGYKLIANIPYNITGAILKKFLTEKIQPEKMVLLVQKEVAERIVARDGKESILSLSVKAYGEPKYIMKVGKRFFSPEPKVDSAIIAINDISRKKFEEKAVESRFFGVIKAGFAHKRKVLIKNLEQITLRTNLEITFRELNIDKMARAETVPIEKWLEMTKKLQ